LGSCALGAAGGFLAGDAYNKLQSDRASGERKDGKPCEGKAGDTNPALVEAVGKVADGAATIGKLGVQGAFGIGLIGAGAGVSSLASVGCGIAGAFAGIYLGTGDLTSAIEGVKGISVIIKP
jgi:hypothetical protein